MTPTTKQNYSYAINEDNTLIHVNTAVRGGMYTCPYCGGEMTPHMGKIRKWHFTHKANLQNCNYETYLHKIAKARIKAAFDNNPHFYIQYDVPVHCDKFDCDVADCKECRTIQYMSFDLKKWYDTCEEEVVYKNFRADLLLSSSTTRNRPPILLEIYVSHKSTQEKIGDGVRIIEMKINSEEDIEAICNSLQIAGMRTSDMYYFRDEKPNNIFFNFNKAHTMPPQNFESEDEHGLFGYKFYLYVLPNCHFKYEQCRCYEDEQTIIPKEADYIICSKKFDFAWGLSQLTKHGRQLKNCLICRFLKRDLYYGRICKLYEEYNLPRQPIVYSADSCPHYSQENGNIESSFDLSCAKYKVVIRNKNE